MILPPFFEEHNAVCILCVILPPLFEKHHVCIHCDFASSAQETQEMDGAQSISAFFARVCCIHSDATIQLHLANNKRYLPSQAHKMNHAAQAAIGTNTRGRKIVVYRA
jgi:hypothetical protein